MIHKIGALMIVSLAFMLFIPITYAIDYNILINSAFEDGSDDYTTEFRYNDSDSIDINLDSHYLDVNFSSNVSHIQLYGLDEEDQSCKIISVYDTYTDKNIANFTLDNDDYITFELNLTDFTNSVYIQENPSACGGGKHFVIDLINGSNISISPPVQPIENTSLAVYYDNQMLNGSTQLIKANYTFDLNSSAVESATVNLEFLGVNYTMNWNATTGTYDIGFTPTSTGIKYLTVYAEKTLTETQEASIQINVYLPDTQSNITVAYSNNQTFLTEQLIKANYTLTNGTFINNATVTLGYKGVNFPMYLNATTNTYDVGFTILSVGDKFLNVTATRSGYESQVDYFYIYVNYAPNQLGLNFTLLNITPASFPEYWINHTEYYCDDTYSVGNISTCFKNYQNLLTNCSYALTEVNCTYGCFSQGICAPSDATVGLTVVGTMFGFISFMGVAVRLLL